MRRLCFHVGEQIFSLPLEAVREVVPPPGRASRLPRAPAPIRGAVNLRGRVVALVDLAALLGAEGGGRDPALARAILLADAAVALLVDEVAGISPHPSHARALDPRGLVADVGDLLGPPLRPPGSA